MTRILNPVPNGALRSDVAKRVRDEATAIAHERVAPRAQQNNGEAATLTPAFGTFTKGLEHDEWGRATISDVEALIGALNQYKPANNPAETPFPDTYSSQKPAVFAAPKYPASDASAWKWPVAGAAQGKFTARNWESPLCGHAFEIDGPDPDQLAMPPAPTIGSHELIAEIAEVYAMACLRDVPFNNWETNPTAQGLIEKLNALPFFSGTDKSGHDVDNALSERAQARRHARFLNGGPLNHQNLFRGSTPGAQAGPYISQFLLIGSKERPNAGLHPPQAALMAEQDALNRPTRFAPRFVLRGMRGHAQTNRGTHIPATLAVHDAAEHKDGIIQYGAQTVIQQLVPHRARIDHMTDLASWLDVQNGANRKGFDYFEEVNGEPLSRFIHTPRDLATYVHFDALYQAYLNVCLILLAQNSPTDIGLPEGEGHPTRDGFASFGGPHILTLVTEVATRARKAVRRQKYNIHLRARPEAIAHAITLAWNAMADANLANLLGNARDGLTTMAETLADAGLLDTISVHNATQNADWLNRGWPVALGWIKPARNALLPMAFPEGSPMHPSYGAGHATVAGACTTILKAFFEMFTLPPNTRRGDIRLDDFIRRAPGEFFNNPLKLVDIGIPHNYVTDESTNGQTLKEWMGPAAGTLTIQGELDKLAANIAIGRDCAGVHYYTDYYESLRMGERVAVGLLQEQMLTYREPVSMRFTSFDGDRILITGTGGSRHGPHDPKDAVVYVWFKDGSGGTENAFKAWWHRALDQAH